MPRKPLQSLGAMVREARGEAKLRGVAAEIGISAATLLRIESGRIPDVQTFGKICRWLRVDPGTFLGVPRKTDGRLGDEAHARDSEHEPLMITAHFKAEQTPNPATVQALATMLLIAAKLELRKLGNPSDGSS